MDATVQVSATDYLEGAVNTNGNLQQGVTSTNAFVDVVQFFSQHVYEDLQADEISVHPILQVDAIRFLYSFRNQVGVSTFHSCKIVRLINYAAHERATPLFFLCSSATCVCRTTYAICMQRQPLSGYCSSSALIKCKLYNHIQDFSHQSYLRHL